ncbi:MAG: amidohydrolase family protein [Bacillota bacterium]
MNIDIHTHFIPREFIELARQDPVKYQARVEGKEGLEIIRHDQGYSYPLTPGFFDVEARLKDMDRRNIDIDVISVAPTVYYYWASAALALEIARVCNDSAHRMAQARPDRLQPMATVPMQDVSLAMAELERVVKCYGFKYVAIGTTIEGRNLDEPYFRPFFKKAVELGMAVIFHPYYVGARPHLGDYYLTNLIGNSLDTTICAARLVLGGVLQECPASKFIFVHGGGYMPYQRGRLQHGFAVRPEPKVVLNETPPARYFDSLYYDTITHWGPALQFLVESHGPNKVMLGSDYPFDMADPDPVKTVKSLNLNSDDEKMVLGINVENLFK